MKKNFKNKKSPVTIKDIAELAGVSVTTVSHALSGERYVKEETKQRILKIINENKYRPNVIARSLTKKASKTIGVILPDLNNPIYTKILKGAESETVKDDYILVISSTYYNAATEADQIDRLNTLFADGFLFIGGSKDTGHLEKANIRNLPAVLVFRWAAEDKYPKVLIDNRKAISQVVDYLAGLGHKNIGYIGWIDENTVDSDNKYSGYLDGLNKNNLILNEKNVFLKKDIMTNEYDESYNILNNYLKSGKKLYMSVLICKNDNIALGSLEAFKVNNLKVPQEISIIGFGNTDHSQYSSPRLSTVSVPLEQMGSAGARLLLNAISGKKIKKETIYFDTSILNRETLISLKNDT